MKVTSVCLGLVNGILAGGMLLPVMAQVISDGTINTIVNQSGNNFTILNGVEKGNNLFHSFSNFSVPTNGSATFDLVNTPNINTIFSRVTGGNVSNIDGLISTVNSSNPVSLFLINPAGIVFGKNASLNIGASFVGTTANSIKFADGTEFSAVNPTSPPLLTVSVPIGLQMGQNPSAIQVQGDTSQIKFQFQPDGSFAPDTSQRPIGLQVKDSQTLALVGGALNLVGGNLTANSGRVELGSVKEAGIIGIQPTIDGFTFSYDTIHNFDDIRFTQAASIETSGTGSGNIQIQGRNIFLLDNSTLLANTLGTQNGGTLKVSASESLNLISTGNDNWLSSVFSRVEVGATGTGGQIIINSPQLLLIDGAVISTDTFSNANAGSLNVQATNVAIKGTYANNDACLDRAKQIDQVDPKAAVIYPIILPDRLAVILSQSGKPLRYYAIRKESAEIEQTLNSMLASLNPVSNSKDRERFSQQIYDWLIRPAEQDGVFKDIKTLVFVLDEKLRNIPMAALYDGKQFLIEKYAVALSPGLQLMAADSLKQNKINAIIAGISESRAGFAALPAVESEVKQISKTVPSELLLNQKFTSKALAERLKLSRAGVVHLATHGQFSSRLEDTYLLTWDGQINVKELSELLKYRDGNASKEIELLVLSACDTATGDDRAVLGLAGLAVKSGARSTIATLWPIKDKAASMLMTQLYEQLRQPKITKAEALILKLILLLVRELSL